KLKRIIIGMCAAAAVILAALIWFLTRPDKPEPHAGNEPDGPLIDKRPDDKGKQPPPVKDKGKPREKPIDKGPRWPELYKGARAADAAGLRKEVEAPFAGRAFPAGAFVATVKRSPSGAANTFATLHEAVAAAPAGKPVVLEVHDNGPLFT